MRRESEMKNDGGPAFPVQESIISQGSDGVPASSGMSLRDWFAGMALSGLLADSNMKIDNAVEMALQTADAMLEARGQ